MTLVSAATCYDASASSCGLFDRRHLRNWAWMKGRKPGFFFIPRKSYVPCSWGCEQWRPVSTPSVGIAPKLPASNGSSGSYHSPRSYDSAQVAISDGTRGGPTYPFRAAAPHPRAVGAYGTAVDPETAQFRSRSLGKKTPTGSAAVHSS